MLASFGHDNPDVVFARPQPPGEIPSRHCGRV